MSAKQENMCLKSRKYRYICCIYSPMVDEITMLDRIDKKILELLQHDGRMTNAALAKRVNLSATPCLERVRKLERSGFIKGYHALLDAERMGSGFVTFVTVTLDRTTEDVFERFARRVQELPEITECHMIGGGFDYILKVRTADMAGFREFLGASLTSLPEIAQTHSYFVMETIVEDDGLPI